jgi:hypothetical protein
MTQEINKGVQILLERVKSNPEEFIPDIAGRYPEKWRNLLQQVEGRANGEMPKYLDFLSDTEIAELWQALVQVRRDQFTKQIMNTLLRDSDLELSYSLAQRPSETQKLNQKFTLTQAEIKKLEYLDPYEKQNMIRLMEEYKKLQKGRLK